MKKSKRILSWVLGASAFIIWLVCMVGCGKDKRKPTIYLDVTHYVFGVVPNDTIPDHEAIQKAINLAADIMTDEVNVIIFLPDGKYVIKGNFIGKSMEKTQLCGGGDAH